MFQTRKNKTEINEVVAARLMKSKLVQTVRVVFTERSAELDSKVNARSDFHRPLSKLRSW